MRRRINNLISVIVTALRFGIMKLIHGNSFKADLIERFSPNVVLELNRGAKLRLGRRVRVHSGCKIKVRKGAELCIGSNVRINYNCILVCREMISIGEGTEFGPSVYVYDHDHDYRAGLKKGLFRSAPVRIGKDCWIGANTVILRGTTIGDNCVIGAGCVVSGTIPDNSVYIQKRTAELKSFS